MSAINGISALPVMNDARAAQELKDHFDELKGKDDSISLGDIKYVLYNKLNKPSDQDSQELSSALKYVLDHKDLFTSLDAAQNSNGKISKGDVTSYIKKASGTGASPHTNKPRATASKPMTKSLAAQVLKDNFGKFDVAKDRSDPKKQHTKGDGKIGKEDLIAVSKEGANKTHHYSQEMVNAANYLIKNPALLDDFSSRDGLFRDPAITQKNLDKVLTNSPLSSSGFKNLVQNLGGTLNPGLTSLVGATSSKNAEASIPNAILSTVSGGTALGARLLGYGALSTGAPLTWASHHVNPELTSDAQGRDLLQHYLYGNGTNYVVKPGSPDYESWKKYMMNAPGDVGEKGQTPMPPLKNQIDNALHAKAKNLPAGSSEHVDITMDARVGNGENITGYNYLHGSNPDVGNFRIYGTISKDQTGNVTYNVTCTWNDIIDTNSEYPTDISKDVIAHKIPGANPTPYRIQINWNLDSSDVSSYGSGGRG